jgi:hypothetical protein
MNDMALLYACSEPYHLSRYGSCAVPTNKHAGEAHRMGIKREYSLYLQYASAARRCHEPASSPLSASISGHCSCTPLVGRLFLNRALQHVDLSRFCSVCPAFGLTREAYELPASKAQLGEGIAQALDFQVFL